MSIVNRICAAHKSGDIDLNVSENPEIAEQFNCARSTVSEARKRLGLVKQFLWQDLIEAHKRGEVDLVNWTFVKIAKTFGCSHHTIQAALENGKIDHVYTRARPEGKISSLAKADSAAARAYWWKYRKRYGIPFKTWGVIPERVGLTRNEWRKKCASM
jgi:hypothetical protein